MNKELISIEEAIFHLHNLRLQLNEHRAGKEYIHFSAYEALLDWSIDAMTIIKDTVATE